MKTKFKVHPAAEIFPMLTGDELQRLADDIKANGLRSPITLYDDMILDGRNRLAACEMAGVDPDFDDYEGDSPVSFVISANIHRRHLGDSQRAMVSADIEPMFAVEAKERMREGGGDKRAGMVNLPYPLSQPPARDQAAALLNVSGKLVSDAKAIKRDNPDAARRIRAGEMTVNAAMKELKAKNSQLVLENASKAISKEKEQSLTKVCRIEVCSCSALFAMKIKCDVVITDPPYPKEFLGVFSELALACKDVPVVAVMVGQSYLPEVILRLTEHLSYRWTMAYLTPGNCCRIWPVKVDSNWKPILVFGNTEKNLRDVVTSDSPDKKHHHWGQSISGMIDLVEQLSLPGQVVCDPFVGGGATAVACMASNRRFIGCDIDEQSVKQTMMRVRSL